MRVVNQITFEAKDDAEALRLAAERLGKDAVILSTRTVKTGGVLGFFQHTVLMVTAGVLEEPANEKKPKQKAKSPRDDEETRRENLIAFQKLMEFKDRSAGVEPKPAASLPGNESSRPTGAMNLDSPDGDRVQVSSEALRSAYGLSQPALLPAAETPPPALAPAPVSLSDAEQLRSEVGELSQRIESLLARLASAPSEGTQPAPRPQEQQSAQKPAPQTFQSGIPEAWSADVSPEDRDIAERLRDSEVDEQHIRRLLTEYGRSEGRQEGLPFTDWLASQIVCSGDNGGDATGGRKIMLLGPTGVGKTTTIAKLAAIQALLEHRNVLLLTSDTYRIAAVDQLRTYAKILGVPIEVIFEAESVPPILRDHDNADLILLDTAGRAQRDTKTLEVFEALYDAFSPDAVHLVLAANMKYRDMLDVLDHLPNIPVSHLIFTKLDETVSYGAIFNIQQELGCPLSFLTVGQNVPKDIEMATGSRLAELLMMTEEERKMA